MTSPGNGAFNLRRPTRHLVLLMSLLFLFVVSPLIVTLRFGIVALPIAANAVLLAYRSKQS